MGSGEGGDGPDPRPLPPQALPVLLCVASLLGPLVMVYIIGSVPPGAGWPGVGRAHSSAPDPKEGDPARRWAFPGSRVRKRLLPLGREGRPASRPESPTACRTTATARGSFPPPPAWDLTLPAKARVPFKAAERRASQPELPPTRPPRGCALKAPRALARTPGLGCAREAPSGSCLGRPESAARTFPRALSARQSRDKEGQVPRSAAGCKFPSCHLARSEVGLGCGSGEAEARSLQIVLDLQQFV